MMRNSLAVLAFLFAGCAPLTTAYEPVEIDIDVRDAVEAMDEEPNQPLFVVCACF